MKRIINFQENIFKKNVIKQFGITYEYNNSLKQIIKFKNDLIQIEKKFGNYSSREIILLHSRDLPPKTKRCALDILNIDESITHTTNRFLYKSKEVTLAIMLNFKKNNMSSYIKYIDNIINLFNLIKQKNKNINILKNKIQDYPNWLKDYFKNNNLNKSKMKTIKFISNIQNFYKSLKLPESEIKFKFQGEIIVTFSSLETKDEFLQKNNIVNYKKIKSNNKKIIINSSNISDPTNIVNYVKNIKINNIPDVFHDEINKNKIIKMFFPEKPNPNAPTIGILDTKMPDNSPFKNVIKVTTFVDNEEEVIHHGEAVASIAYAGDKLNNFDDGCDFFNIHLFEIFERDVTNSKLIERIETSIQQNSYIKVWNLSINSIYEEAFEKGEITYLASELDRIQNEYNIIIIQSAGNKNNKNITNTNILSPSDSIKSMVVNADNDLNSHTPASYALDGNNNYFTKKPDVSFFGGDIKNKINALKEGKINFYQGTSLAAPFVARKMAQLIYYENKSILEAKALLIHSAYVNSFKKELNKKNGWGTVPNHIDDVLNTNNDSIRFIFKEKINDTKTSFMKLKLPQKNLQDYSVLMTYTSSEKLDAKYGCEYVRSYVNVNMGPIDKEDKFISNKKLKPHLISTSDGDILENEKQLIKFYGKWKTTNCAKDMIIKPRKEADYNKYGINAKIDKRMNIIDREISHDLICIVSLIHKDGLDKYNEFLQINETHLQINLLDNKFTGELELKD